MYKFKHLKTLLTCLLLAPAAQADVLTFDESFFTDGTVVDNEYAPLVNPVVNISAINVGGGPNLAVAFDTSKSGTRDPDLEAPYFSNLADLNQYKANLAAGASDPTAGLNPFNPGNVLIIQENSTGCDTGVCTDPDDEGSRPAGILRFEFAQAIEILSMDFFDVEELENGSSLNNRIRLFDTADAEILPLTFYTPDTGGDNLWDQVLFGGGVSGVKRIDVHMGGSGALDNLVYNVVPVPAAVWLFGSALLGFIGFSRRTAV